MKGYMKNSKNKVEDIKSTLSDLPNMGEIKLAEIEEFDKDVGRLEMITARFSSIGSVPRLKLANLPELVRESIANLQGRLSKRGQCPGFQKPYEPLKASTKYKHDE